MITPSLYGNPGGRTTDRSDRKVFFLGSGVSLAPPTLFPTAQVLIPRLLSAVAPSKAAFEQLNRLADPNRASKRNAGDYIRFEVLLDIIRAHADPKLSFLNLVEIFNRPNPMHVLMAQRARQGDFVVTTNFDGLFERAIKAIGEKPISVCQLIDFQHWHELVQRGSIPVFKLHGSYTRYDHDTERRSVSTVRATLEAITAGTTEFLLPKVKREFLVSVTQGRGVIVAGYSGSDDLDIMPTFPRLKASSVLWILHKDAASDSRDVTDEVRQRVLSSAPQSLSAREAYFRSLLLAEPHSVRIVEAHTPTFLSLLCGVELPSAPQATEFTEDSLASFLSQWQEEHLKEKRIKYAIVGQLMMSLSRFQEAYTAFRNGMASVGKKADRTVRAHGCFLVSRAAAELGLRDQAQRWISMALESLPGATAPLTTALCLHQCGLVHYNSGNLTDALRWFRRVARFCAGKRKLETRLAYALHHVALVYQDRGEYRKAAALYSRSIRLSSRHGDPRFASFSFHQLGTLSYDRGRFGDAARYFSKSLRIASTLGDYAQVSNVEHELGMLAFLRGRILQAVSHFRTCIRVNRQTGRSEFTPMHWQHMGVAFLECGKLRAAKKCLLNAKEGYKAASDKDTMVELLAYLAQYHLEEGDVRAAAGVARSATRLARRCSVPSFLLRARFMDGLATYLTGKGSRSAGIVFDAISTADRVHLKALVLDQVLLCAKYTPSLLRRRYVARLVKMSLRVYRRLGNNHRYQVTKRWWASLTT